MNGHAKPAPPGFDDINIRPLIKVLKRLAELFDDANEVVADAVSDRFDDLAAPDWIPLVLTEHAHRLAELISEAR